MHLSFLHDFHNMIAHFFLLSLNNIPLYECTIIPVQFTCSVMSDSVTPRTAAHQASLSITNPQSLFRHMSIQSGISSNHLILCHSLLLLTSIFPSIRVFSNESVLCIKWPKYWSFSSSISPSNEHSGLISFRMVWLDLLAVQGTLKRLLQHHSSKASILQHSFPYGPTLISSHDYWKNHSFDQTDLFRQCNVSVFNMLSRLGIAFLPRSKCLLISCLQSPSAVILELKKRESVTVSIVSASICLEVMAPVMGQCVKLFYTVSTQ